MTAADNIPRLSPFHAAAWSEALAAAGVAQTVVYAWEPLGITAAVGLAQEVEKELHTEALIADGLGLLRRPSGGGAVILAPGMLCFGIVAPPAEVGDSIRGAYRLLLSPVIDVLGELGLAARLTGISDIAAPLPSAAPAAASDSHLYKIAGCAQLRKRRAVLVHGVMLLDADLTLLSKYLRYPSDAPDYRHGRRHEEFCRNISALLGRKISLSEMAGSLRAKAQIRGWAWREIPSCLDADAEALYGDKYSSAAWHWRRERGRGQTQR